MQKCILLGDSRETRFWDSDKNYLYMDSSVCELGTHFLDDLTGDGEIVPSGIHVNGLHDVRSGGTDANASLGKQLE